MRVGGGGLVPLLLYLLWFFETLRVFLSKTILVLRIEEYSIISLLGYFEYTLDNVGLPEAWLEQDSNDVTKIENKCVKHESNQIEKLGQIQSKTVSQIKSEPVSWITL